ncbi:MAG: hypothetical protein WBI57_08825 [Desulfobacterales bacterium]
MKNVITFTDKNSLLFVEAMRTCPPLPCGGDPAAIEPTDLCFTEEIFDLFLAMFQYCISGRTDKEFDAIKEIVREALPES